MRTVQGLIIFAGCLALIGQGGLWSAVGAVGGWLTAVWLLYIVWPSDEEPVEPWGDDWHDTRIGR